MKMTSILMLSNILGFSMAAYVPTAPCNYVYENRRASIPDVCNYDNQGGWQPYVSWRYECISATEIQRIDYDGADCDPASVTQQQTWSTSQISDKSLHFVCDKPQACIGGTGSSVDVTQNFVDPVSQDPDERCDDLEAQYFSLKASSPNSVVYYSQKIQPLNICIDAEWSSQIAVCGQDGRIEVNHYSDEGCGTFSWGPDKDSNEYCDCYPGNAMVDNVFDISACSAATTTTTTSPTAAPTKFLDEDEIRAMITYLAVDEDILDNEDDIKDEIADDFIEWLTNGPVDTQHIDGCLGPYINDDAYNQTVVKQAIIASQLKQWRITALKQKINEIRELMADAKVLKTSLRVSSIQQAGSQGDLKRAIRKAIRQKEGDTCGPTPAPTQPNYIVGTEKLNWNGAKVYCENNGMVLASVHSEYENDMAILQCTLAHNGQINHDDGCWIGLNDVQEEGTWKYVDGSRPDYGFINRDRKQPDSYNDPWLPHEPNNYGTGEHCIHLWGTKQFKWNDMFCDRVNYPLCM